MGCAQGLATQLYWSMCSPYTECSFKLCLLARVGICLEICLSSGSGPLPGSRLCGPGNLLAAA